MGANTTIEWTDATWNPIRGCSRVSEGCRNCYAERTAARFSDIGQPYYGLAIRNNSTGAHWTGEVRFIEEHLTDPLRWKKPRRIFVNSMSDLFHENVRDEWIDSIFAVMALCPQHTFQVLTKRPERMREWFAWDEGDIDIEDRIGGVLHDSYGLTATGNPEMRGSDDFFYFDWPLTNVWLGVSCEDQKTADERIPLLLETPAAVRFVSYEPALGPVDFQTNRNYLRPIKVAARPGLDWVIAGGESGPGARPSHPNWFRSVRDKCQAAGVPFFFKQWGEYLPVSPGSEPFRARYVFPDGTWVERGKKAAGRLLDGREWSEYPVRLCALSGKEGK